MKNFRQKQKDYWRTIKTPCIQVLLLWGVAIKSSMGKLPEFEGDIRDFMKQVDRLSIH